MLSDLVAIRTSLDNAVVEDGAIRGELVLDGPRKQALDRLVEANCCDPYARRAGHALLITDSEIGDVLGVTIHPANLTNGNYYETFERFITACQLKRPSVPFYIHDLNYFSDSASGELDKVPLRSHFAVLDFVRYLQSVADYQDDRDLVFISSKAFVIRIDFSSPDLPEEPELLESLVAHLESATQKLERKGLFISVISQAIPDGLTKGQRFRFLLEHIRDVNDEYRKSHQLYIDQYLFHKVKAELDEKLLDLGDKIQGVINDAQAKLIAVPAAFVLIVTNFDFDGQNLALNIGLVVSSLIFSVLVQILLSNQFASLKFVQGAVDRFESSIDDEKKGILKNALADAFTKVKNRASSQKTLLILISVLVWFSFAASLFLLGYSLWMRLLTIYPVPSPI